MRQLQLIQQNCVRLQHSQRNSFKFIVLLSQTCLCFHFWYQCYPIHIFAAYIFFSFLNRKRNFSLPKIVRRKLSFSYHIHLTLSNPCAKRRKSEAFGLSAHQQEPLIVYIDAMLKLSCNLKTGFLVRNFVWLHATLKILENLPNSCVRKTIYTALLRVKSCDQ